LSETGGGGLLVNWATGIAGAIVIDQKAIRCHPLIGENYGQFGRFLFYNCLTRSWIWRATPDGSVSPHPHEEVRWSVLAAGPYLVRRFAKTWFEGDGVAPDVSESVTRALCHHAAIDASRDVAHEIAVLRWISLDAVASPEGLAARFVSEVGSETGGALAALLKVFQSESIARVVLAGGVGENFGRADGRSEDLFLSKVSNALEGFPVIVVRAVLGIDAEFLGLASDSFGVADER
jgi:hypothetical protein